MLTFFWEIRKCRNYAEIAVSLLSLFKSLKCTIPLKLHFLLSYLDFFLNPSPPVKLYSKFWLIYWEHTFDSSSYIFLCFKAGDKTLKSLNSGNKKIIFMFFIVLYTADEYVIFLIRYVIYIIWKLSDIKSSCEGAISGKLNL